MSYRMRLSKRSRNAGRFISRVHEEIQRAFSSSGMKQNEVAEKLEINRSVVNRQLQGHSNLTLRSIADLAWAMDKKIVFKIEDSTKKREQANFFISTNEDDLIEPVRNLAKTKSASEQITTCKTSYELDDA